MTDYQVFHPITAFLAVVKSRTICWIIMRFFTRWSWNGMSSFGQIKVWRFHRKFLIFIDLVIIVMNPPAGHYRPEPGPFCILEIDINGFAALSWQSWKVVSEFDYTLGYIIIVLTPGEEITLQRIPGMPRPSTVPASCSFICISGGGKSVHWMCLFLFVGWLEIVSSSSGDPVIINLFRIFNSINITDLTCFQINLFSVIFVLFTVLSSLDCYLVILGFVWWGSNTFP